MVSPQRDFCTSFATWIKTVFKIFEGGTKIVRSSGFIVGSQSRDQADRRAVFCPARDAPACRNLDRCVGLDSKLPTSESQAAAPHRRPARSLLCSSFLLVSVSCENCQALPAVGAGLLTESPRNAPLPQGGAPECRAAHQPQASQAVCLPRNGVLGPAAFATSPNHPPQTRNSPVWVHRHQPGDGQPGGGAVLQQAGNGRAVDQGRQAGGEDDTAELPPFSVQRGAAPAEPDRLQPGEAVAGVPSGPGAAEEDRQLVA